jgi:hypothetical protein
VAVWQREQITQIGVAGVTAALRSWCDQLSVELLTSVRRRLRRPPGRPGILGAVFVPCDVVRQAAVAVADHEGLAEDRVKDAVKGFLPGPDPDARRFYSSDSLIVYVAVTRQRMTVAFPCFMVAMKVLAARCEDRRRRHRSALPATRPHYGRRRT